MPFDLSEYEGHFGCWEGNPREMFRGGNYPQSPNPEQEYIARQVNDCVSGDSIAELRLAQTILQHYANNYAMMRELVDKMEKMQGNAAASILNVRSGGKPVLTEEWDSMFSHAEIKQLYENGFSTKPIENRTINKVVKHYANKVIAEETKKRKVQERAKAQIQDIDMCTGCRDNCSTNCPGFKL